jgi:hypothetical protein
MAFYRCINRKGAMVKRQRIPQGQIVELSFEPSRKDFIEIDRTTDIENEYKTRRQPQPQKWDMWGAL